MVKPRSLSATAVSKFELCPARWLAEDYFRARGMSTSAASLGSAVHNALEKFVRGGFHQTDTNLEQLEDFFYKTYYDLFDTDERYEEGLKMLQSWHIQNVPLEHEVISTEVKEHFLIPSTAGEIKFNYIFDRMDRLDDHVYEVIDYKTSMMPMNPEGLESNIQARCYGLAAQIKFPDAERIWVSFDLLRHTKVGTAFSRQQNIATWHYLKNMVQRILEYQGDPPQENVNPQCHWCVRKASCKTLERVAAQGAGVALEATAAADRRAALEFARKGINAALNELDEVIVDYCQSEEILEFNTDLNYVRLTLPSKRKIDSDRVRDFLPADVIARYGNIGVTNVDKILKDPDIEDDVKQQLQEMIYKEYSNPRPKVEPLNPIEE